MKIIWKHNLFLEKNRNNKGNFPTLYTIKNEVDVSHDLTGTIFAMWNHPIDIELRGLIIDQL